MAQGKLKVKAKLPANAKQHSVHRGTSNTNRIRKGVKKAKNLSAKQLLQKEVTKSINMTIEDNCRQKADKEGKQMVTKATK